MPPTPPNAGAFGALLALAEIVEEEGAAAEARAAAQQELLFLLRVLDRWMQVCQLHCVSLL